MTAADLEQRLQAAVAQAWDGQKDGAHGMGHLRRVWANCQRIARADAPQADGLVLMAAAYLHDLVNLPKDHPDRAHASALSAQAAGPILADLGLSPARQATACHAIAAHSFSAGIPPQTIEARILQDANRLEALGAIGLARMFYIAGAMGSALFDDADPLARHRPLDDRRLALDHLEVKLFGLVDTMHTAEGRRIAGERSDWMASFRTRLLSEIG